MKDYSSYQFACGAYQRSDLGNTRISLHFENGTYHLRHSNILGAGQIWEVETKYTTVRRKFRVLRMIQKGNYYMSQYEVSK